MKHLDDMRKRIAVETERNAEQLAQMEIIVGALERINAPEPKRIHVHALYGSIGSVTYEMQTRADALQLYRDTFEACAVKTDLIKGTFTSVVPHGSASDEMRRNVREFCENMCPLYFEISGHVIANSRGILPHETVKFYVRINGVLLRIELKIMKGESRYSEVRVPSGKGHGSSLQAVRVEGLPQISAVKRIEYASCGKWYEIGDIVTVFYDEQSGDARKLETVFLADLSGMVSRQSGGK